MNRLKIPKILYVSIERYNKMNIRYEIYKIQQTLNLKDIEI